MKISVSGNVVTISGNIKSISDYQDIKNLLDTLENKNVVINIKDSISITSSVIGYLNKLVLKDKVRIQMNIGNEQLMKLLEDLNLVSVFNAKKV